MQQDISVNTKQDAPSEGEHTRQGPIYRPAADIFESGETVVVKVDMPGVAPGDVDVTLERRVLTIRGKVNPPTPEGYRQVYVEYGVGDYERVFTLSEEIDRDRIVANVKDGVLTLELPRAASTQPKKIEVKSAA